MDSQKRFHLNSLRDGFAALNVFSRDATPLASASAEGTPHPLLTPDDSAITMTTPKSSDLLLPSSASTISGGESDNEFFRPSVAATAAASNIATASTIAPTATASTIISTDSSTSSSSSSSPTTPRTRSEETAVVFGLGPSSTPPPPPSSRPKANSFPLSLKQRRQQRFHRHYVFFLTFLCYVAYHASRKPLSVVKNVLHRNCSNIGYSSSSSGGGVLFGVGVATIEEEVWVENSTHFDGLASEVMTTTAGVMERAKRESSSGVTERVMTAVTKAVLIPEVTPDGETKDGNHTLESSLLTDCSWAPFDGEDHQLLLGGLDYAFLFAYAIGLFMSGHVAERLNIRYYLGVGMLLCGATTCAFGMSYFWGLHSLVYLLFLQILGGLFQATGWPSVVAVMGNWFGKRKRGLIMGVWNAHTSIGNIIGSLLAAIFVSDTISSSSSSSSSLEWSEPAWGWSFLVPGLFIAAVGVLVLCSLVVKPEDLGLPPPLQHHHRREEEEEEEETVNKDVSDASSYDSGRSSGLEDYGGVGGQRNGGNSGGGVSGSGNPGRIGDSMVKQVEVEEEEEEMRIERNGGGGGGGGGEPSAIAFWTALRIPGVLPFSVCLFFAKLVSYTFLFWLPNYIKYSTSLDSSESAVLSIVFDVGGILGGVIAGVAADVTRRSDVTCVVMLFCATPTLIMYQYLGQGIGLAENIAVLGICGLFVNGPYALITTAVSADLGTHHSLMGNTKALATVSAIIDGAGSVGAAVGPLLTGILTASFSWHAVFYMLIAANVLAVSPLAIMFFKH